VDAGRVRVALQVLLLLAGEDLRVLSVRSLGEIGGRARTSGSLSCVVLPCPPTKRTAGGAARSAVGRAAARRDVRAVRENMV
jgi:hypothetical protein